MALAARKLIYKEAIDAFGPTFESQQVDGSTVVLRFTNLGGGLVARGGTLTDFTVAGQDGIFYKAMAVIRGDTVIVSSPAVARPVGVRYGWADFPQGNLWNMAGLPASGNDGAGG